MRSAGNAVVVLMGTLLVGCGGSSQAPDKDTCLSPSAVDASAPVTRVGVHFMAGSEHLVLDEEVASAFGTAFRPTKARMYLSELALVSEDGTRVKADLVDEAGNRLPYGVTLLDAARPESLNVYLRAPAGTYRGLAVSVGVPASCESGAELNHTDASAMDAPLDVDSDMYWSWDPGYIFLKFEGQVLEGGSWENFFFHVGEEERFVSLELDLPVPFTVGAEGGVGPELIADFNRLLVTAGGDAKPDLEDQDQRRVHGGALATSIAENMRSSGFLRLEQGHH